MGQLPHQTLKRGPRLRENGEPHMFTEMQRIFYNAYNNIVFCTYKTNLKQKQDLVSTQSSIQIGVIRLQKLSGLGLLFSLVICLKPWDNYS